MFTGHSTIDASDTSARHTWSERWPASPKGRIETEPRGPSQLRGVRGVSTNRTVPITNRHDSSWFESFRSHFALFWSFWLAISEMGWTSRKKVPLGIRLKSTRPSHGRVCCSLYPPEARQNFLLPGLWRALAKGTAWAFFCVINHHQTNGTKGASELGGGQLRRRTEPGAPRRSPAGLVASMARR